MAETPLTLFIDLQQGERVSLETAANASLAWARMIKAIGQQIDPMAQWEVQLESALPGSQKIRSVVRVEGGNSDKKSAVRGAIVGALQFLAAGTFLWGYGHVLDDLTGLDAPAEVQALSDEDRRELAADIVRLLQSGAGRDEATEVYDELRKDNSITGAGATSAPNKRPDNVTPRERFPVASVEPGTEEKIRRVTLDRTELTLLRPVLANDQNRRWGFQTTYGYVGAAIHDQGFLDTLSDGKLNVPLVPGIRMVVDMEITEEFDGQIWRPVERVVKKVISVSAPPTQNRLDLGEPEPEKS